MYCTRVGRGAFNEIIHFGQFQCLITPIWGSPREHIYRNAHFNVVRRELI